MTRETTTRVDATADRPIERASTTETRARVATDARPTIARDARVD
jgi:hypothetical protein